MLRSDAFYRALMMLRIGIGKFANCAFAAFVLRKNPKFYPALNYGIFLSVYLRKKYSGSSVK